MPDSKKANEDKNDNDNLKKIPKLQKLQTKL